MTIDSSNEILTPYLNIRTDYGFKRMFGSLARKQLVIRFLNALFPGRITVTDVKYHDKEVLPGDEKGKRIVYDIYCTSAIEDYSESFFKPNSMIIADVDEDGNPLKCRTHHFILEMQNQYEPPFEDRVLYYGAKPIATQGRRGWDYILEPVVIIAVTNFDFPHMSKKLDRRIGLADLQTGELFSDKLQIINLSLAQIKGKKWRECKTELERILYLITNMDKLDKNSDAYKCNEYDEFFDAAETSQFVAEEAVAYSQSLQRLRSAERGLKYAQREYYTIGREEGREVGLAEGRAEGKAEGKAEGRMEGRTEGLKEAALNMKKNNIPINQIMAFTNLPEDIILSL